MSLLWKEAHKIVKRDHDAAWAPAGLISLICVWPC
jgi:hypothetical protein